MTINHVASNLVDLPTEPAADPTWILIEEGFTPAREHEVESLFSIANGYVGSRGSLAEGSALSAPATFVAGVFSSGVGCVPELVRLADWSHLSITVEGHPLRLDQGQTLSHRRILDLRQGMLWREWRQQDVAGRITRLKELRLASLSDRHLLVQSVTLTAENYNGMASIDATPIGPLTQLTDTGITVVMADRTRLLDPRGGAIVSPALAFDQLSFEIGCGETYRLDRIVALYTSRDTDEPRTAAQKHGDHVISDVDNIIVQHGDAWLKRWQASDLLVEGDPPTQQALRFGIYHLSSAANPEDDRVSIGARGLTGTAYKGHVFWDTDIFMLPFFNLTYPTAARALVMYRHHTLPGARAKAARLGYRGALYAWESADTGEEVTPPFVVAPDGEVIRILTGEQEQHISADVAFGVWTYWQATEDERFLIDAGAEILFETARFWASRAAWEEDGCYHIRKVIGPDEYHESVDDDAYTNGMAQWNLETAEKVAQLLAERQPAAWRGLSRRLGVDADELHLWLHVARNLYTGFDEKTGLFEQFQGYFQLEEIDLAAFPQRTAPIDVLLGRERIQRSQIIKQPDVVMLIYLLWERLPPQVRRVNFDYYEPRCGHGSSLSPAIHALVAARLGNLTLAERSFRQTAEIDLANNMGNAAGGIHAAAMGGLWQAAAFGFAGLHLFKNGPEQHPHLPADWRKLSTQFQWRGQWYQLTLPEGREKSWPKNGDDA
jgi:trehalose/maltose hydrolase-like predicted phosphorylase